LQSFAVVNGGGKKIRWTHKAETRPTTSPSRVAPLLEKLVKPSSPSNIKYPIGNQFVVVNEPQKKKEIQSDQTQKTVGRKANPRRRKKEK
jgi:hypothetical protein